MDKKIIKKLIPQNIRIEILNSNSLSLIKWFFRGLPTPPPSIWKRLVIKYYAKKFGHSIFIETGTYHGDTVNFLKKYFKKIISIELDEKLHQKAAARFKDWPNINVVKGDSSIVLAQVSRKINQPIIFWLDGHYSAGETAKGDLNTPIIKELETILEHPIKNHTILIDDARCYVGQNDYPTINFLESFIYKKNNKLNFEIKNDIIRITPIKNKYLFLGKIKNFIISKILKKNRRYREVLKWQKNNCDNTLRLDYPLLSTSIVFDIGGYEGQWTQNIYDKYECQVYIFEPVRKFAEQIKNRFKDNQKILVYNFGLGGDNKEAAIVLSQDGSSTQKRGGEKEIVNLVKISDFIQNNNIEYIDLIKINIEGDEYDLLDDLITSGLSTMVKNIQVQFHNFVPNAKERMKKIQTELVKTHHLTYQYEFVWENWKKN